MNDRENANQLHIPISAPPAIVIVEAYTLTRTCIVSVLKREFPGYEFFEMATTRELDSAPRNDVRLIALNIGDKFLNDPVVEEDLALVARSFRHVPIALLSNRDDQALAAMHRGVRGFFPTSISVEVAIAGLRLVLAGGIYRPLAVDEPPIEFVSSERNGEFPGPQVSPANHDLSVERGATQSTVVELTPREKHVFAELELGLPNKVIASRLNLSENTVKMHIQRIMRKCSARNRTEAVLLCSGRLFHNNGHSGSRIT
jgi:DNA-binding NarL/FixJ family response regulator